MFDFIMYKFERIKIDYIKRSPKGKWIFVRDIGIKILQITGVAILDPNFKVWWYSYSPISVFCNFFACLFYTIWYYSDNLLHGLKPFSLFGVVISVKYMYIYK